MNPRDPFDYLDELELDEYYAGHRDPPPAHPDALDEEQAEYEYMHRYSIADAPCPLNIPHRESDDWDDEELAA